jgi:hypothetical protein
LIGLAVVGFMFGKSLSGAPFPMRVILGTALSLLLILPLGAQEEEEGVVSFIREAPPRASAGTARPPQILPRNEELDLDAPQPQRPNPETIIVAFVNGHVMTRAELDRKVAARLNNANIEDSSSDFGDQGFVLIMGAPTASMSADASLQYRQDRELEHRDMITRMEGEVVQDWVEHKVLSDEARRQGLITSEREFQMRLDEISQEYDLDSRPVDELLRQFGMTRADLEADINDALLIDKLLERYVDLNKPEEFLRRQYEKNPEAFITPPSYRIAHFTISVPDSRMLSSNRKARQDYFGSLEKTMSTVRSRLRSGKPAEEVFAEFNDPQNGFFGTVLDTSLVAGSIPDGLRKSIVGLKEGETSAVQKILIREGADVIPETYHVVRLEKIHPPGGTTFETAQPQMRKLAKEASRKELLGILLQRGSTHRRMTNLGGLNPERLPDRAELLRPQPGIDLRAQAMPDPTPAPRSRR